MRLSRRITLAAAICVMVAQPANVASQEGCRIIGCNSKWQDKSDELPGMTSGTTVVVVAVVVVGAVVAWRLLRSDPTESEISPGAAGYQALEFGVASKKSDAPELVTFHGSPGLSPVGSAVSCRERPRACLNLPLVGLAPAR